MARKKIPPDAFFFYLSLGKDASYDTVAKHYGVSKRAVTRLAVKEGWQERLKTLHEKAGATAAEKARESLEAMNERHLKVLRAIQARALEALRAMPLDTAMAAVRALHLSIQEERSIRGEPGEGRDLESLIRDDFERWTVPETRGADEAEGEPADGDDTLA